MLRLSTLFILLSSFCFGQIDEVRRITKELCSEDYHGRGYVEKGDSLAADFIATEFKKLGVEPIESSYFQYFNLGVNTFPGQMFIRTYDRELVPGKHYMVDPSSSSINGQFKVYSLYPEIMLDQEKLKVELEKAYKGKYRALAVHTKGLNADSLRSIQQLGRALTEYLPVIEVIDHKFTWSVGRDQIKHAYIMMQDSVFESKLELSIEAKYLENYQSQNVIAEIPAKKKCAKTIVFTAHYDHLGRMGKSTYFPGANDNASGTAMLFTMAKYFKEHPSNYNIVFIAFAGEEAGLVGSKYFVEHPLIKLKKIRFLLNLDIMGSGEEGITAVNATMFEKEFKLLQDINDKQGLLANVKKRGPAANSDHYWFTEKGVPAFFIYTMGPNKHYHDIFDTYEELSFKEYEDITTLLVSFVESL